MEAEMSDDVTKTTQTLLGKYVKRPPLTDKLLKKPPFRFLHDIVTSILKTTGFFSGLFEQDELISENVKDRESKILFLNKVIYVISTATGKTLSVKPSKIVAGQEPEKTNELLQCLALALDNNVSSDEAVKLYKESIKSNAPGEKKTKAANKNTDTRKTTSKDSQKTMKNDKGISNISKNKQKENAITGKEPVKKVLPSSKTTTKKHSASNKAKQDKEKSVSASNLVAKEVYIENPVVIDSSDEIAQPVHKEPNIISVSSNIPDSDIRVDKIIDTNNDSNDTLLKANSLSLEKIQSEKALTDKELDIKERLEDKMLNDEECESKNSYEHDQINNTRKQQESTTFSQNSEAISSEKNNTNEDNTKTIESKVPSTKLNSKRPVSVRPPSSRPGAPRLRDKNDSTITSSENIVVGKVNIISENTSNEEEEDASILVIDTASAIENVHENELQLSPKQHGHLVQQILEAQKEFSQVTGKTEIEWQFGAQKARDMITQEVEQLRFNVQALSRVANPLGKVLDHIQEDVEVMRQELHQWTKIYEESTKELMKEKAANEESLFPLHTKIKQLHGDIAEKQDKINDLKVVIHKNASRIEKLLSRGNVQ